MKVSPISPPPMIEVTRPEAAHLDPAQLARVQHHLRSRYIEPGKIAGCLTLVARGDQVVYLDCLGQRDRERSLPMTEDTIFRIYSMTKPITSVALMQLYEQGLFQLDDAVAKLIPAWRDLRVFRSGNHPRFLTDSPSRPMTVRDLLTHQSGLTYDFMERTNVDAAYRKLGVGRRRNQPLSQMIDQLAALPLESSPGERWNYGLSTDVCGYLVEQLSGQRLDHYLQAHLFEPLGMVDTAFWVEPEKVERFAANYQRGANKQLELLNDPRESDYLEQPAFLSGGGGLVSTAHDYLRFCRMLLGGGQYDGRRILGRKTLELMTLNHLPPGCDLVDRATGSFSETTYEGIGFGLGFAVMLDLAKAQSVGSVGEYFWGGAASTIFWVDPSEDLIVVFLTQLMPSGTFNFRGQLKSIVYSALVD